MRNVESSTIPAQEIGSDTFPSSGGTSAAGMAAVDRALLVLEFLAGSPHGLSVTELSSRLGINKGLTHRILTSLAARGYISKEETTQHYQITTRLIALAFRHLRVLDMYDVLLPILRKLARETGELAELNWVQVDRLVTVAKADSPRQLRMVSYLGEEQMLHATAAGKVWLASLPEDDALRRAVALGMPRQTERTITTVIDLQRELALVRERGYAVNFQESGLDVTALAAPIRSTEGDRQVVGTVGIVAPAFRDVSENEETIQMVLNAAREIEEAWPFVSLDG
ncbi:MAG: IclR family transcriptional regulator [Thermomicrobiales bacterium]|nr:IclR family transcriptional regulator [Thermomicrobiales bacterium]